MKSNQKSLGTTGLPSDVASHLNFLKEALPDCEVDEVIRAIPLLQESKVLAECFSSILNEKSFEDDKEDNSVMFLQ